MRYLTGEISSERIVKIVMLFEYIDTYYYDSFFFYRAWNNACANKMDLFIF